MHHPMRKTARLLSASLSFKEYGVTNRHFPRLNRRTVDAETRIAFLYNHAKNVGVGANVRWINIDHHASFITYINPAAQRADPQNCSCPSVFWKRIGFAR